MANVEGVMVRSSLNLDIIIKRTIDANIRKLSISEHLDELRGYKFVDKTL